MKTLLSRLFPLAAALLAPLLFNSCADYYSEGYYGDGYYSDGYYGDSYYSSGYHVPVASSVYFGSHHYSYRRCSSCSYYPCRCSHLRRHYPPGHYRHHVVHHPKSYKGHPGKGHYDKHGSSHRPSGHSIHRNPDSRGQIGSGPSGGSSRPRTGNPNRTSGNRHFDLARSGSNRPSAGSRSPGRSIVPVASKPRARPTSSSSSSRRWRPSSYERQPQGRYSNTKASSSSSTSSSQESSRRSSSGGPSSRSSSRSGSSRGSSGGRGSSRGSRGSRT